MTFYTQRQIDIIIAKRRADPATLYHQDNGFIWKGNNTKTLDLISGPAPLPVGAATEVALTERTTPVDTQPVSNDSLDNLNLNIGLTTDLSATTDIGTFSFLSLFKRLLEKITVLNLKDFATQTTTALIKAKTDNLDVALSTKALASTQTDGTHRTKLYQSSADVDSSNPLYTRDFFLEVSKGNIAKHSRINKSGYNSDIDTTTDPEDLWDYQGVHVPPTTNRIHNIVSTSLLDTAAGTGARTITIQGLNASYAYTTETITLNGIIPVATVNSYVMIDFMFVATAGLGGSAVGNITATAQIDLTITARINPIFNQTQMAIYQVPDGHKAYINMWSAGMYQATASASCEIWLMTKTFGGAWVCRRMGLLNNSGNSHKTTEIKPPLQLAAKEMIKIQVFSVTNNNTTVEGTFDLTLVQD